MEEYYIHLISKSALLSQSFLVQIYWFWP